jgi:hypothetical protein
MADKKLNIKVGLKGAKKAEKGLGKVNNSMKSMAKTAVAAGAAFFAVQGIISGFSSMIRLAGEQEQAEKKLEVALGRTSKALLNQATALQKVTTFGDEAIIGVQASLAAFLDSEEAIKKATEATLDISVAMGMDLKSAGDLVAKTLGSSTNAMSRYGIQVEGAVGSTERLESLTGNVAKLFGGQAKAQAETMTGQIDQMKNAVGDAAEAFGSLLAPVVIAVSGVLKTVAETLSGIAGAIAGDLPEAVLKAAEAFKEQSRIIIGSQEHYKQSKDIMSALSLEFSAASGKTDEFGDAMKRASNSSQSLDEARKKMQLLVKHGIAEIVNETEKVDVLWERWINKMRDKNNENKKEIEYIERLKELYPELAKALGLIDVDRKPEVESLIMSEEQKASIRGEFNERFLEMTKGRYELENIELENAAQRFRDAGVEEIDVAQFIAERKKAIDADYKNSKISSVGSLIGAFGQLNQASKGSALVSKRLAQGEAAMNTWVAVNKALAAGVPPWNIIQATAIGAMGLANVVKIESQQFAQGGIVPGQGTGDTVPAMLTPGEVILNKAQQENLAGGMGGITINISAPLVDETVIDTIIPAIQKAQRMNLA